MTPGQHGEAVRDLQRRLGAAGYLPALSTKVGRYCALTQAAVERFQADHGLRVTGICDETTWDALVEASWELGDRPLLLRGPHLRGDDVVDLQRRLARLGFDCGRIDGIFGPKTAHALSELQVNSGLEPDGACGAETVAAIIRLCRQTGAGPGVSAVREIERLRDATGSLNGTKLVVGQFGGLSALTRPVIRGLRRAGAHVVAADEPDPYAQAATANRFGAMAYLGFEAQPDERTTIAYWAVPGYDSAGGRHLAELIEREFVRVRPTDAPTVVGMRLPVLRETRMPAVLCGIGSLRAAVDHAAPLAEALVEALAAWTREPVDRERT